MALKIIGLSGSLRKGSFNTALLKNASALAPEGMVIECGSIEQFPLYNGDLETAEGIPEPVAMLKERIAAADGLLLATPEYNNSMPGVFKNAIDWLSRPPSDIRQVFGGKPVALMGASPGGFGTVLGQNAWLPVLRTLGTTPWFGTRLLVSGATNVFDSDGTITDSSVRERLLQFLTGFDAFIRKQTR